MSKGLKWRSGGAGSIFQYYKHHISNISVQMGHSHLNLKGQAKDLSTTTRLHAPVCQGYADVPDLELVALQVVSGQRATRRGRAPATAEDKERMLQIGLDRHL